MTPAIGLVVVRGGVAYICAPRHVDIRVIDFDDLKDPDNERLPETLPKGRGFEELAYDAGLTEKEVRFE